MIVEQPLTIPSVIFSERHEPRAVVQLSTHPPVRPSEPHDIQLVKHSKSVEQPPTLSTVTLSGQSTVKLVNLSPAHPFVLVLVQLAVIPVSYITPADNTDDRLAEVFDPGGDPPRLGATLGYLHVARQVLFTVHKD